MKRRPTRGDFGLSRSFQLIHSTVLKYDDYNLADTFSDGKLLTVFNCFDYKRIEDYETKTAFCRSPDVMKSRSYQRALYDYSCPPYMTPHTSPLAPSLYDERAKTRFLSTQPCPDLISEKIERNVAKERYLTPKCRPAENINLQKGSTDNAIDVIQSKRNKGIQFLKEQDKVQKSVDGGLLNRGRWDDYTTPRKRNRYQVRIKSDEAVAARQRARVLHNESPSKYRMRKLATQALLNAPNVCTNVKKTDTKTPKISSNRSGEPVGERFTPSTDDDDEDNVIAHPPRRVVFTPKTLRFAIEKQNELQENITKSDIITPTRVHGETAIIKKSRKSSQIRQESVVGPKHDNHNKKSKKSTRHEKQTNKKVNQKVIKSSRVNNDKCNGNGRVRKNTNKSVSSPKVQLTKKVARQKVSKKAAPKKVHFLKIGPSIK